MIDDNFIIEQAVPLSKSKLWQLQENYFNEAGINAWAGSIPFFITSNPFIGRSYAKLIIAYIRDCIRSGQIDPTQPCYIIELGAGSVQFSFYCARELLLLKQQLQLDIDICLVMTDFVEDNLAFWQQQEPLQPLFEQGILDAALYHVDQPQSIVLRYRKAILQPHGVHNPITVIANYVIDSTRHDAFRTNNDQINEALISLQIPTNNLADKQLFKLSNNIKYSFSYRPIDADSYYPQSLWNSVISKYQPLIDSVFTIPVAMFRCLDHLKQLSNNQLMFIN